MKTDRLHELGILNRSTQVVAQRTQKMNLVRAEFSGRWNIQAKETNRPTLKCNEKTGKPVITFASFRLIPDFKGGIGWFRCKFGLFLEEVFHQQCVFKNNSTGMVRVLTRKPIFHLQPYLLVFSADQEDPAAFQSQDLQHVFQGHRENVV